MMKALGFFEIPSVTAAFAALDVMCKTADVALVTWERKLGGRLVTLIIEGDVAAETTGSINVIATNYKYAVIIISVIPILMVYPFLQKYFTKGVMVGAVKG